MKKLSLLVLTMAFVFTISLVEVYAETTTITTDGTGQAGDVLIASGTFSGQTADLTFTPSANVAVSFSTSTATNAQNYTVSAGHLNGDKQYALASSGGGVYWLAKDAGTAALAVPPTINAAGVADWETGGYAAMQ